MSERVHRIPDTELLSLSQRLPKARPDHLSHVPVARVLQEVEARNAIASQDVFNVGLELAGHMGLTPSEIFLFGNNFATSYHLHYLDDLRYLHLEAGTSDAEEFSQIADKNSNLDARAKEIFDGLAYSLAERSGSGISKEHIDRWLDAIRGTADKVAVVFGGTQPRISDVRRIFNESKIQIEESRPRGIEALDHLVTEQKLIEATKENIAREFSAQAQGMTRRRFLGEAARIAFGSAVAGATIWTTSQVIAEAIKKVFPREEGSRQEVLQDVDVVRRVKAFEAEVGNRPLAFEEARDYIPTIAELFVRSSSSTKSAKELASNFYIVRGTSADAEQRIRDIQRSMFGSEDEKPFEHPIVKQFMKDYPDAKLTENMARSIVLNASLFHGWVTDGKFFLVLDMINGADAQIARQIGNGRPDWQYGGMGQVTRCESPAPAVKLRSIATHEMTHFDGDIPWNAVETEVLDSYKRIVSSGRPLQEGAYLAALKQNFMLKILHRGGPNNDTPMTDIQNSLNEFMTDYLATQISIVNDLPYTAAYGHPYDFLNFHIVLTQAGISRDKLWEMYRGSQIKEFLFGIAQGAQNIAFSSEEEILDFSMERFRIWGGAPQWGQKIARFAPPFQPYYPSVDTEVYSYVDPSTHNPENHYKLGCVYSSN